MRRPRVPAARLLPCTLALALALTAPALGAALALAPASAWAGDLEGAPAGVDGPSAADVLKGLRTLNDLLRRLSMVMAVIDLIPADSTAGPAAVKPGWPHAQPYDDPEVALAR
jgi:hypothetical protein